MIDLLFGMAVAAVGAGTVGTVIELFTRSELSWGTVIYWYVIIAAIAVMS